MDGKANNKFSGLPTDKHYRSAIEKNELWVAINGLENSWIDYLFKELLPLFYSLQYDMSVRTWDNLFPAQDNLNQQILLI